jgi:hypothetical protein
MLHILGADHAKVEPNKTGGSNVRTGIHTARHGLWSLPHRVIPSYHFCMSELPRADINGSVAQTDYALKYAGDGEWRIVVEGTDIGILAETSPVVGDPRTHYLAKHASLEMLAGGYFGTSHDDVIAQLLKHS